MGHAYFCDWCKAQILVPIAHGRTVRSFYGIGPDAEHNAGQLVTFSTADQMSAGVESVELCDTCWSCARSALVEAKNTRKVGSDG